MKLLLSIVTFLSFTITAYGQQYEENRHLTFNSSDLRIIEEADSILSDSLKWNKQDDRLCINCMTTGKYSLYCALYFASINVTGKFDHRRAALQQVRFIVEKYDKGTIKHHRLMDWNNSPKTIFADLKKVLKESMDTVRKELKDYWIEY